MSDKTNRLIREKSPYLLQHARNPVDWFPWGDEAFDKAKREDKPIFLSIGYSTCHWCHVMEKESFEDDDVARLLNESFVSIKVDREERPDLDHIYMNVCQLLTGSGGWPLTILMGWDKKPFYAGTYFPKESLYGRIGMMDMIPRVVAAFKNKRAEIDASADRIIEALDEMKSGVQGDSPTGALIDQAVGELESRFDARRGGFGTAPKFPTPHNIYFLLRHARRTGSKKSSLMALRTLDAMLLGGIRDHVGGGFHRYSTDAKWLLPHFEKMLYDQALIAIAYTEAFQSTGDARYRGAVESIIGYVTRDLMSPEGAFFSAEDADSEGVEGKFYVWSKREIIDILGADDGEFFARIFNATDDGNFEEEAGGGKSGENILHLAEEIPEALKIRIAASMRKLFDVRSKRIRPFLDDKILVDWNGLMIAALAKASAAFGNREYAATAARAAKFALDKMRAPDGGLLRRYRDGEAAIDANLDDYAFMAWGLIELYAATFDIEWLESAIDLTDRMIDRFAEESSGGFFFDGGESPDRISRVKEIYDGATPSGNSVAASNLLRLSRLTGKIEYERAFDGIGKAFGSQLAKMPSAHCHFLTALDLAANGSVEAVIAGKASAPDTEALVEALRSGYLPGLSTVFAPDGKKRKRVEAMAPFVGDAMMEGGKATAYVCENGRCLTPITDPAELRVELEKMAGRGPSDAD